MKSFPLQWPPGWKRTKTRIESRFFLTEKHDSAVTGRKTFSKAGKVTIGEAVKRVLQQLSAFGIEEGDAIISSNLRPKLNGLPYPYQNQPDDPGVAIYWKKPGDSQHKVMAIDLYDRVADNIAAVAATLESMRRIERHGGAVIIDRAFTGFTALPAPNTWRDILGYEYSWTGDLETVRQDFRKMAIKHHPDNGGSHAKMAELNWAWEEAQKELQP